MPRCIDCTSFTLGKHPAMSQAKSREAVVAIRASGFGMCLKGDPWRFLSPCSERACDDFQPVDQAAAAKRQAWLDGST